MLAGKRFYRSLFMLIGPILALGLLVLATTLSDARPSPPVEFPISEERAVDSPSVLPSVRGIIGPRQGDVFRPPTWSGSRESPLHYGLSFTGEAEELAVDRSARYLSNDEGYLQKQATPLTTMSKRLRKEIMVYTVEEGDNVSTIAERFDLSTDTIVWANGDLEADPDYIVVGQKLSILPVPGVLHTVKAGDTLESVAKLYKADAQAIAEYEFNNLREPFELTPGQKIVVPDGEKPYNPRLVTLPDGRQVLVGAPKGLGRFVWPTQGWITTRFGEGGHRGVDIAAWIGAPIYAADAGAVTYAGPLGGYGLAVIIDHGNGYQTIYGHLDVYYNKVGQSVRRGQAIGKMGNTGNSTGPHLHFEITLWGGLVNPLNYLP